MDLEILCSLFAYNRWVNARLLDEVDKVPEERLQEPMGGSFDSIQGTVAHILQGELFYYYRWIGEAQPVRPSQLRTVAELKKLFASHEARIDKFLAELTPERLSAPIRYGRRGGQTHYELPLWQVMLQMINHGTHHRAELADMLTRVGLQPSPTDLIVYYEALAGHSQ